MNSFQYARPSTLEQAVEMLKEHQQRAALLAGGTDLLSLLKNGLDSPQVLVDLKGIDSLKGIRPYSRGFQIGALTSITELLENDNIRSNYPALIHAAEGISSPQVRNRGTVAGDLCQRPRCWYYRGGFGLLAEKDGRSMVRDGDNRYHAILGNTGKALFVNPSSLAPALIAYRAKLTVTGANGEREMDVAELFRTPLNSGDRENILAPDQIVVRITLPPESEQSATYEVRQKEALDWPLAAASVWVSARAGRVRGARVILGHVAPTPWESQAAAQTLVGRSVTAETARQAAEAAVQDATPLSRNAYKVRLAQTAVKRALLRAIGEEV